MVTTLTLNYTPESANFIESGSGTPISTPNPLIFGGDGPYTTKLLIPVHDDDQADPAGSIQVTLLEESTPATTYTVAESPDNTATVAVTDDESLPVVSIVADSGEIAENAGPAMFNLTATGLTADSTLMINATPAEVSGADYLTDEVADTDANFPVAFSDPDSDGTYTGTLSVKLDDDDDGEATGDIMVTLNTDSNPANTYKLSTDVSGCTYNLG